GAGGAAASAGGASAAPARSTSIANDDVISGTVAAGVSAAPARSTATSRAADTSGMVAGGVAASPARFSSTASVAVSSGTSSSSPQSNPGGSSPVMTAVPVRAVWSAPLPVRSLTGSVTDSWLNAHSASGSASNQASSDWCRPASWTAVLLANGTRFAHTACTAMRPRKCSSPASSERRTWPSVPGDVQLAKLLDDAWVHWPWLNRYSEYVTGTLPEALRATSSTHWLP